MADARLNIILHKNQMAIHRDPARYKVIKAGKRFGKTKLALFRACQVAGVSANEVIWYVCPSYRQAKSIAWWELGWMLPKEIIKRKIETELFIEFVNGARLQLIGADNEDSLRGPKLRHVVLDECAYIKEYVWTGIISGQLLGSGTGGTADFISSPNSHGMNWFSNFWADAQRKNLAGDKNWSAHYYTIYDNPTLNPQDIEDLKGNTPDETWQTEYMALESSHAGQIYSEFKPDHVRAGGIPNGLSLVRGLDWGIDHPTVCLWAYVDLIGKHVYITDEYVKSGSLINESCEVIKRMTGERPVDWSVIDPSTNKRNSQTMRTDKDEFARWGVPCVPGDNRDRGYDISKMFFKKNMITIDPKCKTLIYELKNVQWADKTGEDCTDSLRYILVRIHDMMFGGNLFGESADMAKPHGGYAGVHSREINFYDPVMFPEQKQEVSGWVLDEIYA